MADVRLSDEHDRLQVMANASRDCKLRASASYGNLKNSSMSTLLLDSSIRPCYYLLQILGMWRPKRQITNKNIEIALKVYEWITFFIWLVSLIAVMSLDFIHYGFAVRKIHFADILNSIPTCLNLLCPFVFTRVYLRRGQFLRLVFSVQHHSILYRKKLRRKAILYTIVSYTLWLLGGTFFFFHWTPFFSRPWQYVIYTVVILYTTGWWAVWLSIYAFVCDVHCLQVEILNESIRNRNVSLVNVLDEHQRLRGFLERTQKDFNLIISFAVSYHIFDIIVFSFAYFDQAFGKNYKLWQYLLGVAFDLITILIKLFPPALVAAAVHCSITESSKRCHVTLDVHDLPQDAMQLFQYMVSCEPDMGLKILGIRITIEIVGTILMTLATGCVSFVAFIVPRLINDTM
ncbi:uncharacterized protein LOC124451104 [Xenia sp. Carnegie-2017]|uniref:uncharacterized protein LOC124451104 n=1 Tax=Xenia sp. Carnegie-2017 TaxID=2897299 RepID=UPI001F0415C8|nr:uncharacterized protein LOC124451104 [Xenia sp. Carnegie-2017]